jgi:hypothetical protein
LKEQLDAKDNLKMKMKRSSVTSISSILMVAVLLPGFAMPVLAQHRPRPIVITFGQPNIWSLEQAHYLLSRMHRQNLDLQTAPLGSLDPNATNAQRIDILKTLLQAGVSFDQAVGLNNELLRRDKEFNSGRRQQLLNNRSALQTESTQLARDISALKSERGRAVSDEERATLQTSIDAKTEEKAAVDSELAQTNEELKGLTSATGEFQSANLKDVIPATPTSLKGDLDSLISKIEPINPSIAATLRLDNHIGMQYEIISKQLTLLRDEVGPGERLVFLELPQSINATQDRAENKMAQTWWRIAGYTTVDKEWLRTKELKDLLEAIQKIDVNISTNEELVAKNNAIRKRLTDQLTDLCDQKARMEKLIEEKENKLKELQDKKAKTDADREKLCKELIHDVKELRQSLLELEKVIAATRSGIAKVDDQLTRIKKDRARLSQLFTSLSTKYEKLKLDRVREEIREQQNTADRLLQGGGAKTTDVVEETLRLLGKHVKESTYVDYAGKKCVSEKVDIRDLSSTAKDAQTREDARRLKLDKCDPRTFHNLEEIATDDVRTPRLKTRAVRTIDIIPRQNAINVHDTKQRLSRTGIFAAVSFLFGFAGKFSYERQRETAEQFLNQELFTSGFGKGEKDFGWSFFPFAGTKQLSSGVRTTYAVAIIPDDAESVVLKARGCYFPRKTNQPLNYYAAGHSDWTNEENRSTRMCTPSEEIFVLPVPGGSGDGADYYITEMRFTPNLDPGTRMVASIHGQNLPSQVGILINGVPLREAVGLGQLNIESILSNDKTKDNCVGEICGRFERIDANEIVISFNMPNDYRGTPRIGLIGPGRTLELNELFLTINDAEDLQLSSYKKMFGPEPDPTLRRIGDFKVAPLTGVANRMSGVLTGANFKFETDTIFVNGAPADKVPGTCRDDLCIVHFDTQETDYLTVTISPAAAKERTVSKTFLNPRNLSIISVAVASYVPAEPPNDNVLTVKLEGSGFKETLQVSVVKSDGTEDRPQKIVPSAGQMFLKIRNPEAIVQINVVDPATNRIVTAVVARPEPPPPQDDN